MRIRLVGAALFALAAALRGQPGQLGRIDFPTSATGAAQERFVRGVLLLHSFEYDDAAEEFVAAQKADPGFVLAYWGEAMTKNHPIWMQRDAEEARKVLAKLAPTRDARLARAPTRREWGYLDAVETLFAEGDKHERDLAYSDAMQRLHEKYPDDLEAQSFYALALLGTSQPARDLAVYMRAASLAEEVFSKNRLHPGAVHYLIHSYDDPVHAPLGLRPARVYAKIAPAAAHALHMPSHIFLASGMWDDVVSSNEASWAAADERVKRKGLGVDERNFHALYWLEYAYLQQGRVKDAQRLLGIMEEDAKKSGSARTKSSFGAMRAAYAVETGCAGGFSAEAEPAEPRDHFVKGYCSWKKGDGAGIASALARLKKPEAKPGDAPASHAHGGPMPAYGTPKESVTDVFRLELEALALLGSDPNGAIARAREATSAEDAMSFEFGPPIVVKPAHELAGEIFLAQKKPAEAMKEFDAALAHAPGRSLALFGVMRAAKELKDPEAASAATRKWQENRKKADRSQAHFVPSGEEGVSAQ